MAMKMFLFVVFLVAGLAGTAFASHGGPDWEHDDPARRTYGGGL